VTSPLLRARFPPRIRPPHLAAYLIGLTNAPTPSVTVADERNPNAAELFERTFTADGITDPDGADLGYSLRLNGVQLLLCPAYVRRGVSVTPPSVATKSSLPIYTFPVCRNYPP